MAEISKITLPSGNTYDIKDATARQMISGGVSFVIAWDGGVPTVANIPAGVDVWYDGTKYTGTLAADNAQAGAFYLIKSSTLESSEPLDVYDEYVPVGTTGSKTWEKIGDTQVSLADVVTGVALNKQTDTVIGTDATFTVTQPTITLSEGSNGVTFVRGGTTKYMKATASGGGAAWNSKDSKTVVTGYASPTTDTFVKSVSAETNKNLVTTTVPNVTSAGSASSWTFEEKSIPNVTAAGSASTWSFTMGTGDAAETLIISGGNSTAPTLGTAITVQSKSGGSNGSAPTLGTAITVATGATATNGTGDAVVTGVTVGDSASAITALGTPSTASVIGSSSTFTNTQPTVTLSNDGVSGTNIAYIESVDTSKKMSGSATNGNVEWNSKDQVTVLTNSTSLDVTKGA